MTGRIVRIISNLYTVEAVNNGRILSCNCRARGKFRNDGLTPLVGDIVDFNEYIDFDFFSYVINAEGEYNGDHANITFEFYNSSFLIMKCA